MLAKGVAAHRRQLLHVEDAPHGGLGSQDTSECQFSPATRAGVLVGVDDEDLGMTLHEAGRGGMHGEVPEESRPKAFCDSERRGAGPGRR